MVSPSNSTPQEVVNPLGFLKHKLRNSTWILPTRGRLFFLPDKSRTEHVLIGTIKCGKEELAVMNLWRLNVDVPYALHVLSSILQRKSDLYGLFPDNLHLQVTKVITAHS